MRAGDRVQLPGGGTGRVIAPADAAGMALVRLPNGTMLRVPAEQLRRETTDELAARAALRPRTGRVLHLGPIRERTPDAEQARTSDDASEINGGHDMGGSTVPPGAPVVPADTPEAA